MVSEQVTKACKILSVMAMISGSRVFSAAKGSGRKLTLDRDDQLGDDGQNLGASLFEHVENALHGQEAVGVLLFTDAFEENGEVVMVVELGHVHFPVNAVLGTVLD